MKTCGTCRWWDDELNQHGTCWSEDDRALHCVPREDEDATDCPCYEPAKVEET